MTNQCVRSLIFWMVKRASRHFKHPLTNHGRDGRPPKKLAVRYMPFLRDEILTGSGNIYRHLPWWTPCNALLHHWLEHDDGGDMHDHPRWSITICLRGRITELTPWGEKTLRAGSIVFRRTSYIHGFRVLREHSARTWTLFIVGRRVAAQNTYCVVRQTNVPNRSDPIMIKATNTVKK
jgi:hypothetical protein